jgi:spore photoproduct lyase
VILIRFLSSQGVRFTEGKGQVVRDCPGTKYHICCGYKTIDLIEGCILFCSYCILRCYLNHGEIRVVNDTDYVISQIRERIRNEKDHILRFGTGELSDSLALDRRLKLNIPLVQFFGNEKRAIFELKSKWASIDHLLPYLNNYVVISFSLAPQKIIESEEKRTSPLRKRLKTLKKAIDIGCYVGLHFDPIVVYPGFERDYELMIEEISRTIDLKSVIWVSLGMLRFPKKLFDLLLEEKRKNLLSGEFVRGEDGKFRYLKKDRIRAYKILYDHLKEKENNLFIYLCMERADVWKEVTGEELINDEDLVRKFDERIRFLYGGEI